VIEWIDYIILSMMVVIAGYVLVRLISIAYFRTKLEHLRAVLKITGEDANGKK
jgi:hypothetical protein